MTNPVQQSLTDNMTYILHALPEELHQNFKDSIASAEPMTCLAPEDVKAAVEQEIKSSPTIDTNVVLPLVESADTVAATTELPSAEAQASEQQWQLEQRMRECGLDSLPTE